MLTMVSFSEQGKKKKKKAHLIICQDL